jgi:hypothetical protein
VSEHALCKTPGERQNVVVHVSIEECSVHDIDHSQLVAVKPIRFLVVFAFAVVFFVAVWLWHQLIAARLQRRIDYLDTFSSKSAPRR